MATRGYSPPPPDGFDHLGGCLYRVLVTLLLVSLPIFLVFC